MYHALKDLFPGASVRELLVSAQPGWNCFNPSIAFSPTEGYKCIVRTSNYVLDKHGRYGITDPAGTIRTRNLIATLDSNLDLVDLQMIHPPENGWGEVQYPLVRGLEDARLYWDGESWNVYGNLREHRWDGLPTIVGARLDHDQLVEPIIWNNFGICQKNWMIMGEGPDFIYTCYPWATIRSGEYYEPEDQPYDSEVEQFRGSSQAIQRPDKDHPMYIAVTHEVDWSSGHRQYFHRFCNFEYDGMINAYTEPFSFVFPEVLENEPMIEYAAGLAIHGEDFIVSFGYKDARCFLARIPQDQVITKLEQAY